MLRMPIVALVLAGHLVATASAASTGLARIAKFAPSSFNQYTQNPTAAEKQWMRDHYARMLVFSPYFDSRLTWYPNGWVYKDLYAIAPSSATASQHPDWILRDAAGNPLYIDFACSGGTCPQYAGDAGNPAFRSDWIAAAGARLAKGYVGLMIDDVNMRIDRISNGNGTPVAPRDPRTGTTMTEANWRRYVAEFVEQIRAAFPSTEILHNALWFVPTSDPYVQRQLLAADVIVLERGFNDGGIVFGGGTFGFETLLGVIDWLHQRNRGVWPDAEATSDSALEYGLAAYLLTTTGIDYIGNTPGAEIDDWWPGYSIDLGEPLGPRTVSGGVFRRDFANGRVLVNQPGAGQVTVQLGGTFLRVNGQSVTSVTLGAAQGAVLRHQGVTTTTPGSSTTTSTLSPCPSGTGHPDGDGDGLADACDPCTNTVPTTQERVKISLTRLLDSEARHRLKFKGYFLDVPHSPPLDPVANGVRVLIVGRDGEPRVDVTIPGGAYDVFTRAGWRVNGTGSAWTYKSSGDDLPHANGIDKVQIRAVSDEGGTRIRFSVKGKNGFYPISVDDLPVGGTLVIDTPVAQTGQCGEAVFPAAPPSSSSCLAERGGDSVHCK
jgi:hypothetical protein